MSSITEYLSQLGWIFYDSELWQVFLFYKDNSYYEVGAIPIAGSFLIIIWIIEMIIIIGAPVLAAINYNPLPYSDSYNQWYDKYSLRRPFRKMANSNAPQDLLNENVLKVLQELELGRANSHSIVHVFYLPRENKQYL